MAYKFIPGKMYMMPTHFGPGLGPRQGPGGRKFDCQKSPRSITYSVRFLTSEKQLEELLPSGFQLYGEPVVTVSVSFLTKIDWLAGRGYNTLAVNFPAEFEGRVDRARGPFLAVLWENLAAPILTGRAQLGFSKIYCEIPPPVSLNGETHCKADWLGFNFMDMNLADMKNSVPREIESSFNQDDDSVQSGILHYKYVPRTEEWGDPDVEYAVLTPSATPNRKVIRQSHGQGSVHFHQASWEELPTQYHIVNALHELEQLDFCGADIIETVGSKDLSDQRILR